MNYVVLIVFGVAVIPWLYTSAEDRYTTKFDNINVDEILTSERLLNNYLACLRGTGKCTPDGSELKRLLPDALETECSKCSDKQKEVSKKVIIYLIKNKPDVWKELEKLYDPEGKYRSRYEEMAKEEGVELPD